MEEDRKSSVIMDCNGCTSFDTLREAPVTAEARAPAVYRNAAGTIRELLQLPPNWNTYGAPRISPSAAELAMEVLAIAQRDGLPGPAVVPTAEGGIQLEWARRGSELEIEVLPDRTLAYLLVLAGGTDTEEGEPQSMSGSEIRDLLHRWLA